MSSFDAGVLGSAAVLVFGAISALFGGFFLVILGELVVLVTGL